MLFRDQPYPNLIDVNNVLYYLMLLHDYGLFLSEARHGYDDLSYTFWFPKKRFIEPFYRVKVANIIKTSHLFEITLVIASVGALWVFLRTIEKVQNWSIDRKKFMIEKEKLVIEEVEKKSTNLHQAKITQGQRESWGGAQSIERLLVKHLADYSLRLIDIDVRVAIIDDEGLSTKNFGV